MQFLLVTFLALSSTSLVTADSEFPRYIAPGRAERIKRAPRDFGVFTPDCANAAGACNNACYYINCQAAKDPNANKVTFIGPNGNNGEDTTNRRESGCNFENPRTGSVCLNFPFSQKFSSDPHDFTYQCDEWPPASSQQQSFNNKRFKNSLRCMPGPENASLGAQLGAFYNGNGNFPGRKLTGPMVAGDFFTIDLSKNTGKSPFCNAISPGQFNCGNDGFQFGMTAKTVANGKLDSPYNLKANDNRYALQNTVYKDVLMCSIQFNRNGDSKLEKVVLTNFDNIDTTAPDCQINKDGDVCTFKGLPDDIQVKRTGVRGKPFDFTYSDNTNVNFFTWNSESIGPGRGPANDAGKSERWCRVDTSGTVETTECWFPCYEHADGR